MKRKNKMKIESFKRNEFENEIEIKVHFQERNDNFLTMYFCNNYVTFFILTNWENVTIH